MSINILSMVHHHEHNTTANTEYNVSIKNKGVRTISFKSFSKEKYDHKFWKWCSYMQNITRKINH